MAYFKTIIAAAALALIVLSAQTFALTKIIRPADLVQEHWPQASVRETLEYLNAHQWDTETSGRPHRDRLGAPFSMPMGRFY